MKIIAAALLTASFVLGSFALSATDAQARVHHRHVVVHKRVVVRGRHGRRHVTRTVVVHRGRRHHAAPRACRTVLVHHVWVKRC
jgi:Ni/Co efflux regulator RcnB